MRRSNREVTEIEKILEIIDNCQVCRLGLCIDNRPYVVPMSFGFEYKNGEIVMYFHSALEGRKIDMMKENNQVCFEMDIDKGLIEGDRACSYSTKFQSVIGFGTAEFITNHEEKIEGLKHILKHYTDKENLLFDDSVVEKTGVFKVAAKEFTGKSRL